MGRFFDITERDAFTCYKALNELGHNVSLDEVKQSYRPGIGRLTPVKEREIKFTEKEEEEYIKASFAHFTGIIKHNNVETLFFVSVYFLNNIKRYSLTPYHVKIYNTIFNDFIIIRPEAIFIFIHQ